MVQLIECGAGLLRRGMANTRYPVTAVSASVATRGRFASVVPSRRAVVASSISASNGRSRCSLVLGAAQQVHEGRGQQDPAGLRPRRQRAEVAGRQAAGGVRDRGADGKFLPADATIDGDTIVVRTKEVASPTQASTSATNRRAKTYFPGAGCCKVRPTTSTPIFASTAAKRPSWRSRRRCTWSCLHPGAFTVRK